MPDRREVMRVTVSWWTDDPQEVIDYALTYLDEHGPSPVDWVSQGLHAGAQRLDIVTGPQGLGGRGFEILIEGPERWVPSETAARRNAKSPRGGPEASGEVASGGDEVRDPGRGQG